MDEKQMKKEIRTLSDWSSIPALMLMGVSLTVSILGQILDVVLAGAGTGISFSEILGYFSSVTGLLLSAVLFYTTFGRKSGMNLRSAFHRPQKSFSWIVKWGVIACGSSLLVKELLTVFISFFGKEAVTSNISDSMSVWGMLLVVSFISPVMEELTLRGITCRCAQILGERFAIVFSALLFGLMHGNPVQGIYAFIAGLCFGYVFIQTRSLIPCIFIHILFNLMGSLEMIFGLDGSVFRLIGSAAGPAQLTVTLIHSGLMISAAALFVTEIIKRRKREKVQPYAYPMPKSKAVGIYLSAPVTVIALISTVLITGFALVQQYLL